MSSPGNAPTVTDVFVCMNSITHMHDLIDQISERRTELWKSLGAGHDPAVIEEIRRLDTELDELWSGIRAERARIRFGEPQEIVRRARQEERLERAA